MPYHRPSQNPTNSMGANAPDLVDGYQNNLFSSLSATSFPYVFITSTPDSSNGKPNEAERAAARAHVMSVYHRQRKAPPEHQSQLSKVPLDVKGGGDHGKFKLEWWNGKQRRVRRATAKTSTEKRTAAHQGASQGAGFLLPSLWDISTATLPDPFGAMALPLDCMMQGSIQHYGTTYTTSVHPLESYSPECHSQASILALAISSEVVLHVVLAFSRIHSYCYCSSPSPTDQEKLGFASSDATVIYHQSKAMRLISDRIGIGSPPVGDDVITAVLVLLTQHPWIGGIKQSDIHFAGLSKIIKSRGGLDKLPKSLSSAVALHDRKRSMFKGSKPHFPEPQQTLLSSLVQPTYSQSHNQDSIFSRNPTFLEPYIGAELSQILISLYQFTNFIIYYKSSQHKLGLQESCIFDQWNASLEYSLLAFDSTTRLSDSSSTNHLAETLKYASLIWICTAIWKYPNGTSLVSCNIARIVAILQQGEEQGEMNFWTEELSDVLVWILVVGTSCAPEPGMQRASLLKWLWETLPKLNIESPEELVMTMRRFMFIDGVYVAALKTLWEDLMRIK